MKLSQGMVRDFFDTKYCRNKWIAQYVKKEKFIPTDSMLNGLVFEQQVIGMSRGGEVYTFPKLKNGKESKREIDIAILSKFAKETINKLGIELLDVQPEWETDKLIGHPDALINWTCENGEKHKAILDLKFTATKEDDSARWNPFAWGKDLEYKDYSQAIHYVEMYFRMTKEYLPFFYLVFGKSGWVKFINIDITAQSMQQYNKTLDLAAEEIKDFTSDLDLYERGNAENCNDYRCQYCKHEKPKIEIVTI